MGSGVTINSIWKGYKELQLITVLDQKPRLVGVQAEGCSPIVSAFLNETDEPKNIEKGETVASAIRVRKPMFSELALRAIKESNGLATSVTDEEMLSAGREIAKLEGIFAEPASAATVA